MIRSGRLVAVLVWLVALVFGLAPVKRLDAARAASLRSSATDLGTLGGTFAYPTDVNDSGMVVGFAGLPGDLTSHAFVWTQSGGMLDIGTLGGSFSSAGAVNNDGLVVGFSSLPGDIANHAFVWTPSGGIVDLGTLGGSASFAIAVSNLGMVVGFSTLPGDVTSHAFLWTQGSGMVDIGTLGGDSSTPSAVNDRGMIVGASALENAASHAFAWTEAGGMVDLGTLGGDSSTAFAVNNSGMVAGISDGRNFAWTQSGGMVDLGQVGSSVPPAVNDRGVIVGTTLIPGSSAGHGFAWTQSGGMVDIGTLGGSSSIANAVNENGMVVGSSGLPGDATSHAIAWIPAEGMIDLGPAEITSGFATAVNKNGIVVGSADQRALLWTLSPKATPPIAWPTPSDIVYGAALSTTQLNATSEIAGVFTYSPPAGTVLPAGNGQMLTVTFTPADLETYTETTAMVFINVLKATPTITWPRPAAITYGTSLGSSQLNAATNVPGTFVYSPPSGTIVPAGAARSLSTLFTPDDQANYTTAAASVTIDVIAVGPPAQPPFQVVHAFAFLDGSLPTAGLVQGSDALLYGTTSQGGASGAGLVYRMDSAGNATTLHSFNYSDGANPYATLLQASDGFFYGTTGSGGPFGAGTVFRIDSAGAFTTLHSFSYADGAFPRASLIQAADGFLYGTTSQGGSFGAGTVYRMDTLGAVTTMHVFNYGDGAFPYGGLLQTGDGAFYGTTQYAGPGGWGTVFRIDSTGSLTTVHTFAYVDGANPYSGLIQARDGFFYGTTAFGGQNGAGTLYRMDAAGGLTTLHAFTNADGANPYAALLQSTDDFFYGTTYGGGAGQGTVFRMDAAGSVTTLHAFTSNEGYGPSAPLVQTRDGYLYGTTQFGGPQGSGAVFRVKLNIPRVTAASQLTVSPATAVFGSATTLSASLASNGTALVGRVVSFALNGQVVGTATTDVMGTAFLNNVTLAGINAGLYPGAISASFAGDTSYLPASATGDLTVLKRPPIISWSSPAPIVHGIPLDATQLNATSDVPGTFTYVPPAGTILPVGAQQTISLTFTPTDATNYSTAVERRPIDVISAVDTTASFLRIHDFAGNDGATPYAGLIQARDGFFYGTTAYGGANGYGSVYRTDGVGPAITVHAFTAADGAYPYATLMQADDGLLYGTTAFGGPFGFGTVFRVDESGVVTTLHAFAQTDGAYPYGGLVQGVDGLLYGTTSEGGFTGLGTVFRIDPTGALTTVHTFTNVDGAYPYAGLVLASDGFFYGTTLQGGNGTFGTVYRIDATGVLTTLRAFAWNDGAYPYAPLIEGSDVGLYGTTSYGGANGSGTVFRIDRSGASTWVRSFTGGDGANPYSSLFQRSDGFFYGTTSGGGAGGHGTVYRVDASGALRTEHAFAWPDGASPYAGVIEGRDGFLYGTTQEGGAHNVGTVFRIAFRVSTRLFATPATGIYGGTTTLSAALVPATAVGLPDRQVSFTLNGSPAGTAITNAGGMATVSNVSLIGLAPGTYPGAVTATFAGDDVYAASTSSSDLIVEKLPPIVTWPAPSAIVYGTALDSTQLNATANVPGEFLYSPPTGSILPAGSGQVLTVQFVPADSAIYASVLAHVLIDVSPARAPTSPTFETLHAFTAGEGANPYAALIQAADGFFYGTTYTGGVGYGTVFRMDTNGSVTPLHAFTNSDGANPIGGLIQGRDGLFYGTTSQGGSNGAGTVFRMDSTGAVTTLHAFTVGDGAYPYSGVIQAADGSLYGTTYYGGASLAGTAYRVDPATGDTTTLHSFNVGDGAYPFAGLIQADDALFYGTTYQGGSMGYGVVYRMDSSGAVNVIHNFSYGDGGLSFLGGLVQASDGAFYGTTPSGGATGAGVAYRIDQSGNFRTLRSFAYSDGAFPHGVLLQRSDGLFYGTTSGGGAAGQGTVFRLDGGGAVTTLHGFTFGEGATPYAGLIEGTDHKLYGTTFSGGGSFGGNGTVFRITLRTTTQLTASAATAVYGGTTSVTAALTAASSPLAGREISFTLNGMPVGLAVTDGFGVATIADVNVAGITAATYPNAMRATFTGEEAYAPSAASADFIVSRATPIVTWPAPAPITFGTPLGAAELNATSNVPGTPFYDPPFGTVLPVGAGQGLSVTFVPFDTTNYTNAFATVTIDVTPAPAIDLGTFSVGAIEIPLMSGFGDGTGTWIVVDPLPPGMSLRTDGPVWFPPNASAGLIGVATTPGTYQFTLRVTGATQSYDQRYTITITSLLASDPYQLPDAFVGVSYSYTLSSAGGSGAVVWTPTGDLPPGITLDANGTLSGAAAMPGFYNINFKLTDGVDTVFRSVSLFVSAIEITSAGMLPNATQSAFYSVTLTASGGSGSYTFTSNSLPPGLTLDPSGTISGVVTAGPGKWGFNITATDTNFLSYTKSMSIDVISTPPTLASLFPYGQQFDDCTIGVPCTIGIGINNGGTAPFTWTATNLPPGMWIRSGSGATQSYVTPGDAQIVGAPTTTGTYVVEVTARDALGATATNVFPLHVSTLLETDFPPPGTLNTPYAATLRVIGGLPPYTVAMNDGGLPAGTSFDSSTLRVSGTPIESGNFRIAWQFADAGGATLLSTRYQFINSPANITINDSGDLGSATIGSSYSRQLFACCLHALAWSVVDGMLPPGLTLSADGVLAGTPTVSGRYIFLVHAADPSSGANYGARQFTLVVTPLFQTTRYLLPNGFVNTPYSVMLTARGATGAPTWTLARSNYLPPGLTLDSNGTVHGTPTGSGQYFFSVRATDAAGDLLIAGFNVSIYPEGATPPVRIVTGPFYGAGLGQVEFSLTAVGGNGTYDWEIVSGSLPPGLSLRSDRPSYFPPDASAGIIGVATTPGTYSFTLRATSGAQSADQIATVRVSSIVLNDLNGLPDAFVGAPYSYTMSAANDGGVVSWSANGGLPAGLTLTSDGVLSGTPTTAGFFIVNLRLSDGVDAVYTGIGLNVYDIAITTPPMLPNATQNAAYSTTVAPTGGVAPYTFSVNSLPPGMALDPSSGTISGFANGGPGKYNFTLTVTDANHRSYSKPMSIDVIGVPRSLPAINASFDDCTFAVRCDRGVGVFNGGEAPFTWDATGLPPGMQIRFGNLTSPWLSPGDAEIIGAATAFGSYSVTVTVRDKNGVSATNTFPLRVSTLMLTSFLPSGELGGAYSHKFRVIGGPSQTVARDGAGLYDAALVSDSLPRGVSFDAPNLLVAGTLEESGSFFPQFRFSDRASGVLQATNFLFIDSPISIFTPNDLGTATLNAPYSNLLFACCASSFTWSVADGSLPPGVTLTSAGLLAGAPSAEGTFTFLVQATDDSDSTRFGRRQFTLTVTPLAITNGHFLQFGNVGSPYETTFTTVGGSGAVIFALAAHSYLPPGLTLDAGGLLHGTPTATGEYFFTVNATDSAGHFAVANFRVSIFGAGEFPPLNPTFGPTFDRLAVGPLFITLSASGGAPQYHYSLTPGASDIPGTRVQDGPPLPTFFPSSATAGLVGVITTPGTYHTSIRVTDASGGFVDRPITLVVNALSILSQNQLPKATRSQPYAFTFTPFGGSGSYSWSAFNLPSGVSMDSVSGEISGTPTTSGTFFPSVTLTDVSSTKSIAFGFTLVVDPFAIETGAVLPPAVAGAPYTQTLAATGCGTPCNWTTVGGGTNIPGGLSLNSNGVISGTPSFALSSFFTVRASGPNGTVLKVFSLIVDAGTPQPLSIANNASINTQFGYPTVGNPTGFPVTASGGTPPFAWSFEDGELPPGTSLQTPGETLSSNFAPGFTYVAGRPQRIGTFTFTLRVTDSAGASATRTFTWYISALNFLYFNLPIAGNPLVYNTPYSQALLVVGGTNKYTWSTNAPMVPGLVLDPTSGVVSGAPTNTGTLSVPIQVTDDAGNLTIAFNVTFAIAGPTPTPISFGAGPNLGVVQQGFGATFNLSPSGGTPPYTITALTPLPPGFVVESGASVMSNGNPANSYLLAGNPLASGSFAFTLKAEDAAGNIGVRTFTLSVAPFTLFTSTGLPDASLDVAYSQSLVAFDNNSTVTWTAATPLPPGLSISSAAITGTPTTAGLYNFTLIATDSSGVVVRFGFGLRVSSIAISDPQLLPDVAIAGTPFSYTFTATGGGVKTWSAAGAPAGLTMSASGTLSGTPPIGSPGGASTFTVIVTDGASTLARRFTLLTRAANPAVLNVLTPASLPDVAAGQSTVFTLAANGGTPPYGWSVAPTATVPPGLGLIAAQTLASPLPTNVAPASTLLAGMPSAAGRYTFDLIVTDAAGAQAQRTFTLNVSSLVILSGSPRNGTAGVAYGQRFTAAGGTPPYTFAIAPVSLTQDMLPPGFSVSPDGLLSGTTTSTGIYNFIVTAADAGGNTFARSYSLVVANTGGLFVTNANPSDTWLGRGRALFTLNTNGTSTYTWSLVDGMMPPGVALIPGNTIGAANFTFVGGRPTASGTYTFTLRATDTADSTNIADHTFTYRVAPMQVVTPPIAFAGLARVELTPATVGVPYLFTLKADGGTPPYSFVESPFNPLPAGLSLEPDGTLTGTPQSSGTSSIVPIVIDAAGATVNSLALSLTVTANGAAVPLLPPTNNRIVDASVGSPFSFALDVLPRGGTTPFTWDVAAGSVLPPGLSLAIGSNGARNSLEGVATTAGVYSYSLVVSDAAGQTLTILFVQMVSPLAVAPDALPAGILGVPYSVPLVASDGTPPYTIQLSVTSDLPPGLTLDESGLVSGTPTNAGNFLIVVLVADSAGNQVTKNYLVRIDNAPALQ